MHISVIAKVVGSIALASHGVVAVSSTDYTQVMPIALTRSFEGWGTSLGWWAQFAGRLSTCKHQALMDLIFSRTKYPSLGLNIIRYNIGGSPPTAADGTTPADPLLTQHKGVAAFQTSPNVWNWNADMSQRRIAIQAQQMGVNIVEAFSNSPPWWMTISGTSRGNYNGGDNLASANFNNFAKYLAIVVKTLRDKDGINITSIEPFNEPNVMWWQASRTNSQQEGCTYLPRTQASFIPILRSAIDSSGLTGKVGLTTADEYAYNWSLFNLNGGTGYGESAKANVHGYGYSTDQSWSLTRQQWRAAVPKSVTRTWMSECGGFGQTSSGIIGMASNIILDINIARVNAWVFWQVLDDNPDWTLVLPRATCPKCGGLDPNTFDPVPSNGFYGFMQFSNHIRPGSVILSSSRSSDLDPCIICVVVSWNPAKSVLTIVAVNSDPAINYMHTFDLSKLAGVSSNTPMLAYRTAVGQNELHKQVANPVGTSKGTFSYSLPSMSITTFLLSGVTVKL
ncbi:hypothetical protein BDEG_21286 [Batrachochytrium dendrobatidis JEL423]|uniref:Endo-beta-1,6-galactanase-like domain-containing protein n=1 Tax=Batrachochytrium dendrobatidis (strain JEL423) TaxID=403673 RepID=A0A177WCB4_BATDL|nr:hypothetical protein BDEG_21286 [Batrachochytrium dendrobatidis JEL423]